MVQPIAPLVVQSGEGGTIFKEYVEKTNGGMCVPPQEPPMERSHIATLGIPIQAHSSGTLGGVLATQAHLAGTSLEFTRPSAPTRLNEPKIRV